MPIYSYECYDCGSVHEEYKRKQADRLFGSPCQKCGGKTKFVLSLSGKDYSYLYPYYEENFEHNPVEIQSLRHYREEQKKRGLVDGGKPKGVKGQWT